jgi:hypothetical protein
MEVLSVAQPDSTTELQARNATLSDQLLQARADLHRLGVADQNRALALAGLASAVGLAVGVFVGVYAVRKKSP